MPDLEDKKGCFGRTGGLLALLAIYLALAGLLLFIYTSAEPPAPDAHSPVGHLDTPAPGESKDDTR